MNKIQKAAPKLNLHAVSEDDEDSLYAQDCTGEPPFPENPYENARPFNYWLKPSKPWNQSSSTGKIGPLNPLSHACVGIYGGCRIKQWVSMDANFRRHLEFLLLECIRTLKYDPSQYIRYTRDNTFMAKIKKNRRLNPQILEPRKLNFWIDTLATGQYLEHIKGYKIVKDGRTYARQSRFRPTAKLADMLFEREALQEAASYDSKFPVIRMSLKGATEVLPRFTKRIAQSEDVLKRYNSFMAEQTLCVPNPSQPIFYDLNQVYRVCNNNRWDHGGRVYGAWWHNSPKNERRRITINGKSTVELDFSGFHFNILYALQGKEFNRDPYMLEEQGYTIEVDGEPIILTNELWSRRLVKYLAMPLLNASDLSKAHKSLIHDAYPPYNTESKVKSKPDYMLQGYLENELGKRRSDYKRVVDDFNNLHTDIAHHMHTGAGIWLMSIDSDICVRVLDFMTNARIPCLSIHDSFVVTKDNQELLRLAMIQAYQEILKVNFIPKIDCK